MKASRAELQSLVTLRARAEFLAVQSKGRKWTAAGVMLQVLPNGLGVRRVGYTVSKRVDKSAVKRNRIKRRLRAAAADVLPAGAPSGHDYILVGRAQSLKRSAQDLRADVRWCLKKLGLLEGTAS
jgi:ribonuclease P protein component